MNAGNAGMIGLCVTMCHWCAANANAPAAWGEAMVSGNRVVGASNGHGFVSNGGPTFPLLNQLNIFSNGMTPAP